MEQVTIKTSSVFIGIGTRTLIYRSLEDVPEALRIRMAQSLDGANSATILIADRGGREQLIRAIQGLPASLDFGFTGRHRALKAPAGGEETVARRGWLELALIGLVGLFVWSLMAWK